MVGGQLVHNTIVANQAPAGGNAFVVSEDLAINWVSHNIMANAPSGSGLYWQDYRAWADVVAFNDLWSNVGGNYFGLPDQTGVVGNISADPMFVVPVTAGVSTGRGGTTPVRDLHLDGSSPCIDAGDPNIALAEVLIDIDGDPRLMGERVDLGADETPGRNIARAGQDIDISRPRVITLDGTASYFCTQVQVYSWRQMAGPVQVLAEPETHALVNVAFTQEGVYQFSLTVGDGVVWSRADEVVVRFINHPPVADAGQRHILAEAPAVPVILDGSGSTDPDGDSLTKYQWRQVGGESVAIAEANQVNASVSVQAEGVYTFELVVSDGLLDSAPDLVQVVVGLIPPVAKAGRTWYAAGGQVTLDGRGSFDPVEPNRPIQYLWRQISGPPLTLAGMDTARPLVSGIQAGTAIRRCTFELVVSNGLVESDPASVDVVIVESPGAKAFSLQGAAFDPNKPTIVAFNGGNCVTGGAMSFPVCWTERANVLSTAYGPEYYLYGDALISYLSRVAPDYRHQIQTIGWSTGAQPATDVAIRLNCVYGDPRYAVNRVVYVDAGCVGSYDYPNSCALLLAQNKTGRTCFVENYYSIAATYWPNMLNIQFPAPAGHGEPQAWYRERSWNPAIWPSGDMFNGGAYGGYYLSVIGPAKNLTLASDPRPYYFRWVIQEDNLTQVDRETYPGLLPEPVRLLMAGPVDGNGVILTCAPSRNAVAYELLWGPDPGGLDGYTIVSDTPMPPQQVCTELPWSRTWWTIRARDAYGSTIYADPIPADRGVSARRVFSKGLGKWYAGVQWAIDQVPPGDELILEPGTYMEAVDLSGKTLTLRSVDPADPTIVGRTAIQGPAGIPAVRMAGGEKGCVLCGLTITGPDVGVSCDGTTATLDRCAIVRNGKSGVKLTAALVQLNGCVVAENQGHGVEAIAGVGRTMMCIPPMLSGCVIAGNAGSGIWSPGSPTIVSCTIADNGASGIAGSSGAKVSTSIVYFNSGSAQIADTTAQVLYSDVQGGGALQGNIDQDPLFVRRFQAAGMGSGPFVLKADYHLRSQSGRWDQVTQTWVQDQVTSPCIDAGDPAMPVLVEPEPNGARVNMGAYGGTAEASKS